MLTSFLSLATLSSVRLGIGMQAVGLVTALAAL